MAKGSSDIPDLRLSVLQRTIESFQTPPNLLLSNLFSDAKAESDTIEWETIIGTRGLTPFVAPGAPAPLTAPLGHGEGRAASAYYKEKMYYGEEFLNNLRQVGTREKYMPAKQRLAKDAKNLRSRIDRRKEWMYAKMLTVGSFSYLARGGLKLNVDYSIPTAQNVTLAADRKWDSGAKKNAVEDIFDAKLTVSNSIGAKLNYALFPTEVLKLMVFDTTIQTLLSKSSFGNGDLFARPLPVLSALLDIDNFILYDEQYQVTGWLTGAVTGSSTTAIPVDDTTDFEVGGTLVIYSNTRNLSESLTIASIQPESGTVTVSVAPTNSYKSGEDRVSMTKKYLPTNQFNMFASSVEGDKIAEFMLSPFGLARNWGISTKSWDSDDPEGTWIMIESKGLPILYRPQGVYILKVKD